MDLTQHKSFMGQPIFKQGGSGFSFLNLLLFIKFQI